VPARGADQGTPAGGCPAGGAGELQEMGPSPPVFFFDYLDPLSYLLDRELRDLGDTAGFPSIRRVPIELRPPPAPLLDPDEPAWRDRWSRARAEAAALGVALAEPPILFWTRKAHELVLHASASGLGEAVHRLLFDAVFVRGHDIGRIDVLVELGREAGLARADTRVALDVDRYDDEVAALRREAERADVAEPPAVARGPETLRGFHNRDALRTFLLR